MAEADKILSETERRTAAPSTIVRSNFKPYPNAENLREWAWIWEAMTVKFLHARQHECLPHWRIAPRRLPNAILFFVHKGRARWWISDVCIVAEENDLVFIPENVLHSAEHMHERKFCVSAVHFTARLLGAMDVLALLSFPFHVPKMQQVQSCVEELLRLSACSPLGWQKRGAALVTDLILRVAQERPHLLRPMATPFASKTFKFLQPVLQFIEDHLADKVDVKGMAQLAMCSERHLRRLFRQTFGMSPKQWLLERRLQKAALLLTQTDLPLKLVCVQCGFDDLSHFHRFFRRRFGHSPKQYRQIAQKSL